MTAVTNFSGRWKADLASSRLHGQIPGAIVVTIAHSEPELRAEMTITTTDGTPMRIAFDARTTGEPIANTVLGGEWVSRSRWIGHELLIESHVSQGGRQLHFCDYWSVSADGHRMTMEHRDDDLAGQLTVLDRVEDEANAGG